MKLQDKAQGPDAYSACHSPGYISFNAAVSVALGNSFADFNGPTAYFLSHFYPSLLYGRRAVPTSFE